MNDTIVAERKGDILYLTLNRPTALNAINDEMSERMAELGRSLVALAGDARVIVLRGAGASFMAGGDIRAFEEHTPRIADLLTPLIGGFHVFVQALADAPQPVLCSVRGAAAGGGFSLAIGCDLVIAGSSATFTPAYRRLGTSPDGGATYTVPRMLGEKRALELLLLSDRMTAAAALDAGLISRVVPDDDLDAETMRLAATLAANAPVANAATKRLIRSSYGNTLSEQLTAEHEQFIACAQMPDFAEGVGAFLEKRRPAFR